MDGGSAGERAEEFVSGAIEMVRVGVHFQIAHDGMHDFRNVLAHQHRRHRTKRQPGGTQRIQREPGFFPLGAILEHAVQLMRL